MSKEVAGMEKDLAGLKVEQTVLAELIRQAAAEARRHSQRPMEVPCCQKMGCDVREAMCYRRASSGGRSRNCQHAAGRTRI